MIVSRVEIDAVKPVFGRGVPEALYAQQRLLRRAEHRVLLAVKQTLKKNIEIAFKIFFITLKKVSQLYLYRFLNTEKDSIFKMLMIQFLKDYFIMGCPL